MPFREKGPFLLCRTGFDRYRQGWNNPRPGGGAGKKLGARASEPGIAKPYPSSSLVVNPAVACRRRLNLVWGTSGSKGSAASCGFGTSAKRASALPLLLKPPAVLRVTGVQPGPAVRLSHCLLQVARCSPMVGSVFAEPNWTAGCGPASPVDVAGASRRPLPRCRLLGGAMV